MSESLIQQAVKNVGPEFLFAALSDDQRELLKYEWRAWARPEQLAPPGAWLVWLILAGRGFGKTRTGAEWVREEVENGRRQRIALVAPTAADARDVMVEGESGILAISSPRFMPEYEPSKRRISWPNGATATVYTADEPERLRGPQHDGAWCDEPASWRYPDAWDMLQFGLRLGDDPRTVVTGTPKPIKLIRDLMNSPTTAVTRGSTYDNKVNLAPSFLTAIEAKYKGTRLGRQEMYAEMLDDVPGALWQRDVIDRLRVRECPRDIVRTVVAVDPSGGAGDGNDAQGIVVASKCADGHAYVRSDNTCKQSPDGWGRETVKASIAFQADRVLGERNFGGDMVQHVVQTAARAAGARIAYQDVSVSRGKIMRAEPVAALYEQGLVHHVGCFNELEDEQCRFVPGQKFDLSPNRADALVIALTVLMLGEGRAQMFDLGPMPGRRM